MVSVASVDAKRSVQRRRPRRLGRLLTPYVFLLPASVLIAALFLYPIGQLFNLALHASNTVTGVGEYVGSRNFERLLTPSFLQVIGRTLVWVFVTTPVTLGVATFLAVLLNLPFPGRDVARILVFVPWAIPQAITAILFKWLVHIDYGMLNHALVTFGLAREPVSFLGIHLAFYTAMAMRVWHGLPFATMTLVAALQAVPVELYEAARVDGASGRQQFLFISLPLIRPAMATAGIILTIWGFTTFDMLWVLTQGGPLGRSEILPLSIYRQGFHAYDAGLASAMALTSLVLTLALTIVYYRRESEIAR